jgi:hypothetical protein
LPAPRKPPITVKGIASLIAEAVRHDIAQACHAAGSKTKENNICAP